MLKWFYGTNRVPADLKSSNPAGGEHGVLNCNRKVDPTPFLAPFLVTLLDPTWDDATFVRDLVPDGTVFAAEARFTQQWFLRNSGNHG